MTINPSKKLLASLGLVSVLAFGTMGGGQAAHAANAGVMSVCEANQVRITVDGGSAGAGHIGIQFRVKNRTALSCSLRGYPTVVLLDTARRPLPTTDRWGGPDYLSGSRPVRTVRLAPGGSAYFIMEWVHFPEPGQTCPTGRSLLILPPGAATALVLSMAPDGVDACGGKVTVSPIEPTPYQI